MPKTVLVIAALALAAGLCAAAPAAAASDAQVEALIAEVKALKARVAQLEERLGQTCEVQEEQAQSLAQAAKTALEARGLALKAHEQATQAYDRARTAHTTSVKASRDVEVAMDQRPTMVSELGKRLSIHGQVQVEGSYSRRDRSRGRDQDNSELSLATAEIFFEGDINRYTRGVIHFLFEEGDTEPLGLDEAFLLIGQTEELPWYLMAGRIYPAVGLFESFLVSDTIAKNLFETQETAVELGYAGGWFNASAGFYSGALQEADQGGDAYINSGYARLQARGEWGGLSLDGGLAYTNNLGDAGGLLEEIPGERVQDLVGGLSASLNASYGRWTLLGEYITALDDFAPGELAFAGGRAARPSAYNLELAFLPWEEWIFAARYEGSDDLYQLEPERQYGAGASWAFLPDTFLAVEYLRGEYPGGGRRDLFTSQLTIAY
jgi:hypothetical protein